MSDMPNNPISMATTTRYFPNGPCPEDSELTHLLPVTLQSTCAAEWTYPPEIGPVEWHYCKSGWGASRWFADEIKGQPGMTTQGES